MRQVLAPGTFLRQRYEILALIGQGGMGAVYKASDHRLPGRLCAIKETWPLPGTSLEALESARAQFLREASTLARLDHPNLPKVSDHFTVEPSADGPTQVPRDYLVMDYVPGRDLQQVVQAANQDGTFLSWLDVRTWLSQLCAAVTYLHTQDPPVLHRDIKPANVKLTPDNLVKLVDFGLVKPLDPQDPHTITGLRGIGSLPYTPIEQYAGELGHTSVRSDLYGLAATLYHLLTGSTPASAQDRFLDADVLVSPRQINPQIPPSVERVVLEALSLHPKDRPASVSLWAENLLDATPSTCDKNFPHIQGWLQAVWQTRWAVLIAVASVAAAIVITLR